MSDVPSRGPIFTYVTDEDLDLAAQKRVIREFIACADVQNLRVAFRLPRWTDSALTELVGWYIDLVEDLNLQEQLLPPLVHDHPEVADLFPAASLWLPWRNLDLVRDVDRGRFTLSVHNVEQCQMAIAAGAKELVFGHVFSSESHPGEPGRGIAALQEVMDCLRTIEDAPKITAIGGMNRYTMPEIGKIHFESVSGMRIISRADTIRQELQSMQEAWTTAWIASEVDDHLRSPFSHPSSVFF